MSNPTKEAILTAALEEIVKGFGIGQSKLAIQALKDAAALPAQEDAKAVSEGYVLALQTVLTMPDGKKELGHTLIDGVGLFPTEGEVHAAIHELSLPLGWVSMTARQLLPGWMLPAAPTVAATPSVQGGSIDSERAALELAYTALFQCIPNAERFPDARAQHIAARNAVSAILKGKP